MSKKLAPFKLTIPLIGENDFRMEGNQKYFCFGALLAPPNPNSLPENHLFTFGPKQGILIILDDNSVLVNQIKTCSENDLFTTPITNLNFKPNFIDLFEGTGKQPNYYNALLVKEPNQVEKISQIWNLNWPEITFKVVKQYKEDQRNGNYKHVLEIEPLDLGIEDFPKITKLLFLFNECSNAPVSEKSLKKSKFYNSSILTETVGKNFSIKVKCWNFGLRNSKYHQSYEVFNFQDSNDFDFDSFQEIPNQDKQNGDKDNDPTNSEKGGNKLSETNSSTLKKTLIAGGIIAGIILVIFLLCYLWKKTLKK